MPFDDQWLPTLAAAAIGLVLMLLLVALAYREGKRIGMHTRSERFNRLPSELRLNGTVWNVEFTEFGRGLSQCHTGWMHFRQYGSRVIGHGEDEGGHVWTAEGVVYHDKLCYVILDVDGRGQNLGTVMVDYREQAEQLDGMRCVWSQAQNSVIVQPIRMWSRSQPVLAEAETETAVGEVLTSGDRC